MNKPSQPKDVPQVAVPASDTLRPPVADAIGLPAADFAQAPPGKQAISELDSVRIPETAAVAESPDVQGTSA